MKIFALFIALIVTKLCRSEAVVHVLVIREADNSSQQLKFDISSKNLTWNITQVYANSNDLDRTWDSVSEVLRSGSSMIMDFSWIGWNDVKILAGYNGIPYFRVDISLNPLLEAADQTITVLRQGTNTVLIFQDERSMAQSLYYIVRKSSLRVLILHDLDVNTTVRLRDMRPSPSFYVIFGNATTFYRIYETAVEGGLTGLNDRWHLAFADFSYETFNTSALRSRAGLLSINKTFFCASLHRNSTCPEVPQVQSLFLQQVKLFLDDLLTRMWDRGDELIPVIVDTVNNETKNTTDNFKFYTYFMKTLSEYPLLNYDDKELLITPKLEIVINSTLSKSTIVIGNWRGDRGIKPIGTLPQVKRFFRIGTGYSIPFAYPVRTKNGSEVWEGFCIEFIDRLAKDMNFDYEMIYEIDFGNRSPNGTWSGLVGHLSTGKIDIIIASLTMTSEREEVIDFVTPYFHQTGILIVIRKPLSTSSLFKFMTVLRVEVWISILFALSMTAIMLWFLDKYSPYSAQNNKKLYPYPCRKFTLRESFWFSVTSFTPQGGGEAPKSLSARTLVAAYWLFVVLMLATFTANLAAFLTVERMQSPVQSLEQLSRQSRINYTVVKDSHAHFYFRNMKNAEDILYRMWKEIALNSTSNQSQYRVWDYPIKEQYGHILAAIERVSPVTTVEEGFEKVLASEKAEFALIHDALEIRYKAFRNCNLTIVGEFFAEQPYSVAVQQGSHLNEELSRRILDLQKDRFFETLTAKYWNRSGETCEDSYEGEGITLESLGGVFIATFFGLALAMITLTAEVFYYRRKRIKMVAVKNEFQQKFHEEILSNKEFGIHPQITKKSSFLSLEPKISYMTVNPRGNLY